MRLRSIGEWWITRRGSLLAGAALVFASATSFESYANRTVLGRWSPVYASALVALAIGLTVLATLVRRRTRAGAAVRVLPTSAKLFDLAVLAWGAASVAAAAGARAEAARLVDGFLFGSTVPIAVLLDGFSLAMLGAAYLAWAWARRDGAWAGWSLALGACLVFLVLGELGLRVRAVVAPQTQGFPTFTSALWMRRYVTLNSRDFRDSEHELRTSPRRCRLAVVGDSYAFGVGIPNVEDRFGERLQRELRGLTNLEWESINASRGDTHTLQHIQFLRELENLQPDLVILLYVFNDVDYLQPVTSRSVLSEAPRSVLDRLHPARLAFYNSFLAQEVYLLGRLAVERARAAVRIAMDPYSDSVLVARHLTDLAAFASLGTRLGAVVRIVPMDIGVVGGGYALERYEGFVKAATNRHLPVVSLQKAFAGHTLAGLRVNRFDGHPNETAYRLAAAAVMEPLSEAASDSMRTCMPRM